MMTFFPPAPAHELPPFSPGSNPTYDEQGEGPRSQTSCADPGLRRRCTRESTPPPPLPPRRKHFPLSPVPLHRNKNQDKQQILAEKIGVVMPPVTVFTRVASKPSPLRLLLLLLSLSLLLCLFLLRCCLAVQAVIASSVVVLVVAFVTVVVTVFVFLTLLLGG